MIINGKILVPTDFSKQSNEALRRACLLAAQLKAEVHLLHVIESAIYIDADLLLITPIDEIVKIKHDRATKQLAEQATSVEATVTTHLKEADNNISLVICDFSTNLNADQIVIGRHGDKGMFEHMMLGSTAERVVRHAPCSVLVVMPHGILGDTPSLCV